MPFLYTGWYILYIPYIKLSSAIMQLIAFLDGLWRKGEVTVANDFVDFSAEEMDEASLLLELRHQEDRTHMPGKMPDFHGEAAAWAAITTYRITQLIMLRKVDDIARWFLPFAQDKTAETIYSADLSLRYIPQLLKLTKALAPDDPLGEKILEVAYSWPYSSVGIGLEKEVDITKLHAHTSLFQSYIDRIIHHNAKDRATHPNVIQGIRMSLGMFPDDTWSEFFAQVDSDA